MVVSTYLLALGSNRPHHCHKDPRRVVTAAMTELAAQGCEVRARSKIRRTPALGPAGRDFANAAILIRSHLSPHDLLTVLKRIEREFGRRPGRRWGARVLDLDILLWSGGIWPRRHGWPACRGLAVPHRDFARRDFVLLPAAEIAGNIRHPVSGLRVRHLAARHNKARARD